MAGLKLQAVTKSYDGKTPVIKQIDLDVADGEFIVMVGPSGCGKSTLLRMVAGLERTTSGDIYIDTRRVTDLEPEDRGIAMVFQNYALYPHMSVYDNMAYGLKIRGFGKDHIRQRVEEAARILELEPLLKRKPRELSGGQRQRVAMGRAIVREPAVFLFDEPLSNLDAKLRVQMRLELQQLHRRLKTTSLYVTHDQVEAMTLAQRVIVMNKGRGGADRHPERSVPTAGFAVCRGLYRIAGDEPAARHPQRRRRPAAAGGRHGAAVTGGQTAVGGAAVDVGHSAGAYSTGGARPGRAAAAADAGTAGGRQSGARPVGRPRGDRAVVARNLAGGGQYAIFAAACSGAALL